MVKIGAELQSYPKNKTGYPFFGPHCISLIRGIQRSRGLKNLAVRKLHFPTNSCKFPAEEIKGGGNFNFDTKCLKMEDFQPAPNFCRSCPCNDATDGITASRRLIAYIVAELCFTQLHGLYFVRGGNKLSPKTIENIKTGNCVLLRPITTL